MVPSRLLLLPRLLRWPSLTCAYSAGGGPAMEKPVGAAIRAKLQEALKPVHLEVIDDSHMHAVPRGAETHFRVVVASPHFEGLSLIHRHRLVNDILQEELAGPVHALSIQARTPQQWQKNPAVGQSPPCLGGSKHDPHMASKVGSLD
ncbi:bolA-like protein 1 [Heteronotia binoei]|uniref:bolA-like protein 1 n=1 Tax=Heteronotia binoei TaxID=13085 RepID=UPI00292DE949|nr:bolA-like protein 1 [Heteronotia binoei]XP_060112561.1 bolA-like protein 1 [Heteronotia binoei]